jgi:calcium permeable stress-gated cation channel
MGMAYAITFFACYLLLKEYESISNMRLHFLASEKHQLDQFAFVLLLLCSYLL